MKINLATNFTAMATAHEKNKITPTSI